MQETYPPLPQNFDFITPRLEGMTGPRVAFDIHWSKKADVANSMYDIDTELLQDALQCGGMIEEDMATYPIVVRHAGRHEANGLFEDESDYNRGRPVIGLNSYKGKTEITTRTAAHEARHLADHVRGDESTETSDRMVSLRKVGITVGTLVVGTALLYPPYVTMGPSLFGFNLAGTAITAIENDVVLCAALSWEYRNRKHEKRAFAAEADIESANVLIVQNNKTGEPIPFKQRGRLGRAADSVAGLNPIAALKL